MSTVSKHHTKTVAYEESAIDVDLLIAQFCADAGEVARKSFDSPEFGVLVMAGREGSSGYVRKLFDGEEASGVTTDAWMALATQAFISGCVSLPSVVALAQPAWLGDADSPTAPAAGPDFVWLRVFDLADDDVERDFVVFRAGGDGDGVQLTPWVESVGFVRGRR
jgi:hypothetical protein